MKYRWTPSHQCQEFVKRLPILKACLPKSRLTSVQIYMLSCYCLQRVWTKYPNKGFGLNTPTKGLDKIPQKWLNCLISCSHKRRYMSIPLRANFGADFGPSHCQSGDRWVTFKATQRLTSRRWDWVCGYLPGLMVGWYVIIEGERVWVWGPSAKLPLTLASSHDPGN